MSVRGIQSLQHNKMVSKNEKQEAARDKVNDSIERHEQHTNRSYDKMIEEANKTKEAADEKMKGQLLGTIFLGPLIGTLIGDAIGGWANDSEEDAARNAKTAWGKEDQKVQQSSDALTEAKKEMEDANSEVKDAMKFGRELRDVNWTGTV